MSKRPPILRGIDAQAASFDRIIKPEVLLPGGAVSITRTATQIGRLLDLHNSVFFRGGALFRLEKGDTDVSLTPIKPAGLSSMMEQVARICTLQKIEGKFVSKPTICPEKVAKLIAVCPAFLAALPELKTLTACPVIVEGPGGSLREIVSYDYDSSVYANGQPPLDMSLEEARIALTVAASGFRFASEGDKARALAMLITPALVMGGLLKGRSPIDLGEADESQTGKGYRNKIKASIYSDIVRVVTQRKGGVGSLMESFNSLLISGRQFISFDNLRGRINEPSFEAFMTEDSYAARAAYHPNTTIDPRRFLIMMTSNQAELTDDLSKRCCCVRILKQPDGYQYQRFPEGDLLDHIRANQPRFLGAIFATVKEWHRQGCRRTDETRHDFREWTQILDWICQNLLETVPIMDGHQDIQVRASTPYLGWLREVSLAVKRAQKLNIGLTTSEIIQIIEDEDIDIPGLSAGESLGMAKVQTSVRQQIGRRMAKIFKKGDCVQIDTMQVERHITQENRPGVGGAYDKKTYRFSSVSPADSSSDPSLTPHTPPH